MPFFKKPYRKRGISRTPYEWLTYADKCVIELSKSELKPNEEKELPKDIKEDCKTVEEKEKVVPRKPLQSEGINEDDSQKNGELIVLHGINHQAAMLTACGLFMVTSSNTNKWKIAFASFLLGMFFTQFGFQKSERSINAEKLESIEKPENDN
ncbi:hypothetical protein POMI540_1870 [Schizosaccharomyces pombe]